MALIYNATFDKNTRKLSFEDKAGNEIYSFTVPERGPAVDDITKPLTFKAIQDGSTVMLQKSGSIYSSFQTSRDGGNTWVNYTIGASITLNTGDEVSFRVSARQTQNYNKYFQFKMTGKIEAWHNVMSMIESVNFATHKNAEKYAFYGLFDSCTSLTKAPVLPANRLNDSCYKFMFSGCRSLTKAPELPATYLPDSCYHSMFSGCRSLKEVRIAATTTNSTNALKEWLKDVSATGDFYCDSNATIFPTGASGIPENWRRLNINEVDPTVDDFTKPLTFRATQDGSKVTLSKYGSPDGAFQTSRDGGNTWTDYTIDTAIALNTGEEVSFRAKTNRTSGQSRQIHFYFTMTGKIEAWHNVMSLYRTNDFATYNTMVESAFNGLFSGCKSLVKAPKLPSTTLATDCYEFMFAGCQSLTKAPELPATTLVYGCYSGMFQSCYSLTEAPVLHATTLAEYCYYDMFDGCQSLVKAPELPATTLAPKCYYLMFTLCSSLKEVRIAATTTADRALYNWLSGVSATGDFYCDPNATIFPTDSASGIPKGWTRVPAVDDITKPLTFKATQD